jgi:hypothetical protein
MTTAALPRARLSDVTADILSTKDAAYFLNRAPQTLRLWATGGRRAPIQPRRINGRLAWSVAEIRALVGAA